VPGQPDRTEPTRETIMKSWIGLAAIAGTHAGCPENYPFAYFGGKYCCYTGYEKPGDGPQADWKDECNGSKLYRNAGSSNAMSVCCDKDYFAFCQDANGNNLENCQDNLSGIAKRTANGAIDDKDIMCGGCPAGQECRFDKGGGATLNGQNLGAWNCELTLIARNAIIGVLVGLFLLLLLLLIIWCCCKRRKNRFEPTYLRPKEVAPLPREPSPVPIATSSSSSSPSPSPSPSPPPRTPTPEPIKEPSPIPSSSSSSSSSERIPTPKPRTPSPLHDDPVYQIPAGSTTYDSPPSDDGQYVQMENETLGDVSAIKFRPINPTDYEKVTSATSSSSDSD
jgi:hypothetical protein